MKQTVNFYDFRDAFKSIRPDNFTNDGLYCLFDWIEELEESTGKETELDVIALCCDFTEYDSMKELKEDYSDIQTMEDLEENTIVIPVGDTGRFIIQVF